MTEILQRYRTLALDSNGDRSALAPKAVLDEWVKNLGDDGVWPDLDLQSKVNTQFPAGTHLGRVVSLYAEYVTGGQDTYRMAGERALEAFVQARPKSWNWWQNEIGMPRAAATLLVVAGDQLPPRLREAMTAAMGRPLDRETNRPMSFTGQNLLWRCGIALLQACMADDAAGVDKAVREATGEMIVTAAEGIQTDGSFHQHGAQLYSHGYGRAFTSDASIFAMLLADTPWALEQPQLDALARHCLDGQQWMMRGDGLDFHPLGRELSRPGADVATRYPPAALRLAKADHTRAEAYRRWARRITGAAAPLEGNRYFWRSDYFVHQRAGFYFSARLVSDRTCIAECINRENVLGGALSAGATCLMRTGREYRDVAPLWDWAKLPGATTDADVNIAKGSFKVRGKTAFVGGASDGRFGAAAMDYARPWKTALHAKKAYLAFDEGVVCLGADIVGGSRPLVTGVEQRRLDGSVLVDGQVMPAGEHSLDGATVVAHGDVRYVFAPGQAVRMKFGPRTGSWRKINHPRPDTPVQGEVFGLWIDHTQAPAPASYAYTILVGEGNPLKILRNDGEIQAAMHEDASQVQAVFYSPGSLETPGGTTICVDQPCIVLLTSRAGRRRVTVADPTQALPSIVLTVDDQAKTIELPRDQMAGSSVTAPW